MKINSIIRAALSISLFSFCAACATPPRAARFPLEEAPGKYSRVEFAALRCDATMQNGTDDENGPSAEEMAAPIEERVRKIFEQFGYTFSNHKPLLLAAGEWPPCNPYACTSEELENDLYHPVAPNEVRQNVLSAKLYGVAKEDVDAILFVSTTAELEPLRKRKHRRVYNSTVGVIETAAFTALAIAAAYGGGGIPTEAPPIFKGCPSWIRHTAVLLDARSGQIVWGFSRVYMGEDARSRNKLADTCEDLIAELPKIRK